MIVTETQTIKKRKLKRTYSDKGFYIKNTANGAIYSEAIDIENSDNEYVETTSKIEIEEKEEK